MSEPAPRSIPARRRIGPHAALLLALLAAAAWAAWRLELRPADLAPSAAGLEKLRSVLAAALRPATESESTSPAEGPGLLAQAALAARSTASFALVAIALASLGGLVLGAAASTACWRPLLARGGPGRALALAVVAAARFVAVSLRSVHELLWAVLFLAALGLSPATGVLALALPYGGGLAKVFSEMIDEAPRRPAEALEMAGSPPLRAFLYGLLPRALPDMLAYVFYRLECALRSSAVLGFFGFETLGLFVRQSFENLHYRELWTYLYTLLLLVIVFELWSGALRRRLVR